VEKPISGLPNYITISITVEHAVGLRERLAMRLLVLVWSFLSPGCVAGAA
jgi:hypothetical protein